MPRKSLSNILEHLTENNIEEPTARKTIDLISDLIVHDANTFCGRLNATPEITVTRKGYVASLLRNGFQRQRKLLHSIHVKSE